MTTACLTKRGSWWKNLTNCKKIKKKGGGEKLKSE
jgi:hypothetical protein